MLQARRQYSVPMIAVVAVLAAIAGAMTMYIALPCGVSAAVGTGPDCAPTESLVTSVYLYDGYNFYPTLLATVEDNEHGYDQYVVYARKMGDDSWIEVGRFDSDESNDGFQRPRWMRDGIDYEYYVVGFANSESGDYSNIVKHVVPPLPTNYRAFEKMGTNGEVGYVVKWNNSEDERVIGYNTQYKLRSDDDWLSSVYSEKSYRRFDGLHQGRWYDFRIQSVTIEGRSSWNEVVRLVPNESTANPASVRNFDAELYNGDITLNFDRYQDLTAVYLQVKRTHNGETTVINVWNQPDTQRYVDTGATGSGRYEYRMRAVNRFMEVDDDRMNADTWSTLATVTR